MFARVPFSAASLAITIVLGLAAGLLTGSRFPARVPLAPSHAIAQPGVRAELSVVGEPREDSGVEFVLTVHNDGPGDLPAPLEGVLSLSVLEASRHAAVAAPCIEFIALDETTWPPRSLATLGAGKAASKSIPVRGLPPLDHAGEFTVGGELVGPAGVLTLRPIRVSIGRAPLMVARAMTAVGCGP